MRSFAIAALLTLAACSGSQSNACTSPKQCTVPSGYPDGSVALCLGFCDGNASETVQFLADGGLELEPNGDGGFVRACPDGHVTGAGCAVAQPE